MDPPVLSGEARRTNSSGKNAAEYSGGLALRKGRCCVDFLAGDAWWVKREGLTSPSLMKRRSRLTAPQANGVPFSVSDPFIDA